MYKILLIIFSINYAIAAENNEESLKLLNDVFNKVHSFYINEVDQETLLEYAINGVLSGLDPHSSYLNSNDLKQLNDSARGEFGGIGIEVTIDNGLVKVIAPVDDTPAFYAGIKAGDYISQIEGESVSNMSFFDAVKKMRGDAGTELNILVLRPDEAEPIEFRITRDVIKVRSVRYKAGNDGVIYVRLSSFNEKATDDLRNAVMKLKSEHKMKGLVLDLRNNPGGLLDQAVGVSNLFLKNRNIVTIKARDKNNIARYTSDGEDIIDNFPIVVLINSGSASASEIVAGALQDNQRAVVLGTRSFGKGSVQTVMPLPEKGGAIRLTTALYYTASGRSIQAEGIIPDIELCGHSVLNEVKCNQNISEASLPNHIKLHAGLETPAEDLQNDLYLAAQQDYQLAMAIKILRGMILYHDGFAE